jgi:ketosteroid isomerase-like protein
MAGFDRRWREGRISMQIWPMQSWKAAVAALYLAVGLWGAHPADSEARQQQTFTGQPEWARVLVAADMEGGAGAMTPPPGGLLARLTFVQVEGGVARVVRFTSPAAGASRMTLLRFTGHPRVGWSQWGGDSATVIRLREDQAASIQHLLATALRAGTLAGEPRQATSPNCADGAFAYLEIAQGAGLTTFERRCISQGAAASAISALSAAAGSETEQALLEGGMAELMEADRAFNRFAQEKGVPAAFVEFAHEEALFFLPGREPYRGKDGVRERFARWPGGAKLFWAPEAADVSARGDMGWTWGRGRFVMPDGKETPSLYVSVWRRDFDGRWRWLVDIGVDGPPLVPLPPALPAPPAVNPSPPLGLRR